MNVSKEEREIWRERMTSRLWCGNPEPTDFTLRLIDALEQAEAERFWLAGELVDRTAYPHGR